MIFPIGDDNTGRKATPLVNYALMAANILVFVLLQGMGSNEGFTLAYSTVPAEILSNTDIVNSGLAPTPIPVYGTLLSAIFMHGSIMHLLGNMMFLWIFGDNLEDRMGHLRYLLFYLVCGILASLAHVWLTSFLGKDLLTPCLGASGAISGVLAGYLVLFPSNKVRVIMFYMVRTVSALLAIGLWFAFQIISSLGLLGGGDEAGGVAYGAHIGGFIAGLILVKFFAPRIALLQAKTEEKRGLFQR